MTTPKREAYLKCRSCKQKLSPESNITIGKGGAVLCEECVSQYEADNELSVKVRIKISAEMDQAIQRLVEENNHRGPVSNTKGQVLRHLLEIGLSKVADEPELYDGRLKK